MTDRTALADRLEALAKKATPELHIDSDSTTIIGKRRDGDVARDGFGNVAEMVLDGEEDIATRDIFVDLVNNLPVILAALREPGFTPEQEAAIKRVDMAGLRAVSEVAHRRGAEAMREKVVQWHLEKARNKNPANSGLGPEDRRYFEGEMRKHEAAAAAFRALPLPEPKP